MNGRTVHPTHDGFSGFIFKIQANMDAKHRDRLAFVRICSGKFKRDMSVIHTRTGKKVRLASSHKLFGRERETVDEAFAGDVVQYRLQTEYGAESRLEHGPWKVVRWIADGVADETMLPSGARLASDVAEQAVSLFTADWSCNVFIVRNPGIKLQTLPPRQPERAAGPDPLREVRGTGAATLMLPKVPIEVLDKLRGSGQGPPWKGTLRLHRGRTVYGVEINEAGEITNVGGRVIYSTSDTSFGPAAIEDVELYAV